VGYDEATRHPAASAVRPNVPSSTPTGRYSNTGEGLTVVDPVDGEGLPVLAIRNAGRKHVLVLRPARPEGHIRGSPSPRHVALGGDCQRRTRAPRETDRVPPPAASSQIAEMTAAGMSNREIRRAGTGRSARRGPVPPGHQTRGQQARKHAAHVRRTTRMSTTSSR